MSPYPEACLWYNRPWSSPLQLQCTQVLSQATAVPQPVSWDSGSYHSCRSCPHHSSRQNSEAIVCGGIPMTHSKLWSQPAAGGLYPVQQEAFPQGTSPVSVHPCCYRKLCTAPRRRHVRRARSPDSSPPDSWVCHNVSHSVHQACLYPCRTLL